MSKKYTEEDERRFDEYLDEQEDKRERNKRENRARKEFVGRDNFNPGDASNYGYGRREDPAAVHMDPPQVDYSTNENSGRGGQASMSYDALWNSDPLNKLRDEALRNATSGNLRMDYRVTKKPGSSNGNRSPRSPAEKLLWEENDSEEEPEERRRNKKKKDKSQSRDYYGSNDEEDYYGGGGSGRSKGGRPGGDHRSWLAQRDPNYGGKSWLLKKLKAKFMQYQVPIVKFVHRYLGFVMGPDATEDMAEMFIKVIPNANRIRPSKPEDFKAILDEMHDVDPKLVGSMVAFLMRKIESDNKVDRAERALMLGISGKEDGKRNRMIQAKQTMMEALRENALINDEHFSELDALGASGGYGYEGVLNETHKRLAIKLWDKYKYLEHGTVGLFLDGVLRGQAENVLADINGKCHGGRQEDYFTLAEIMNSDVVLTKFIFAMVLYQQSNPGSIKPLFSSLANRGYGTVADRINSGLYSGKGGGGRLNIIQSRATLFNIMSGSFEYAQCIELFRRVKRETGGVRGGSVLVWDIPGNSLTSGNDSSWPSIPDGLLSSGRKRTRPTIEYEIYWDSANKSYERRPIENDSSKEREILEAEDDMEYQAAQKGERFQAKRKRIEVSERDGTKRYVEVRRGKSTVDSFESYNDRRSGARRDRLEPTRRNSGNERILSYQNRRDGQKYLVKSSMYSDPAAVTYMWERGIPPAEYVYGNR